SSGRVKLLLIEFRQNVYGLGDLFVAQSRQSFLYFSCDRNGCQTVLGALLMSCQVLADKEGQRLTFFWRQIAALAQYLLKRNRFLLNPVRCGRNELRLVDKTKLQRKDAKEQIVTLGSGCHRFYLRAPRSRVPNMSSTAVS